MDYVKDYNYLFWLCTGTKSLLNNLAKAAESLFRSSLISLFLSWSQEQMEGSARM